MKLWLHWRMTEVKIVSLLAILILAASPPGSAQTAIDSERQEMEQAYSEYEAAYSTKDYATSLVHAKRTYELAQHVLPEASESFAIITFNYGENLLRTRQSETSVAILEFALHQHEALHGDVAVSLVPILLTLGEASAASSIGRKESQKTSLPVFRRAIKISEKHYGKNSVPHANVLFRAGVLLLEKARSNNAKAYLEKAHAIYVREFGEQSTQAGATAFNLGKFSMMTKRWSSAEKYLLQAVDAFDLDDSSSRTAHLRSRAFLINTYESSGQSDSATEHCLAIGRASAGLTDEDYEPIFRVAPKYPEGALMANVSGYVDLSFTVDANGFVRNPVVVNSTGSDQFIDEAIRTAKQWRYAPRFASGQAIDTTGVTTRIRFQLVD